MQRSDVRALAALALGIAGGLEAAPGAGQTIPPQSLLRMHVTAQFYSTGTKWIDEDLFVSTSGYSQAVTTRGNLIDPLHRWNYKANAAKASPEALAALRTALEVNQIGIQPSCILNPGFPGSGTVELTWYGHHLRRNDLRITLENLPPESTACPPEVCNLLAAINAFGFTVHNESGLSLNCSASP